MRSCRGARPAASCSSRQRLADVARLPAERGPRRDPGDIDVLRRDRRCSEREDPQRSRGVADQRRGARAARPRSRASPCGDDRRRVVEPSGAARVARAPATRAAPRRAAPPRRRPGVGQRSRNDFPPARDARDLRLLEHHLADEDRPGLGGRPPRKVVPPVHRIPAREPAGPHAAQFVRLPASSILRRAAAWRDTRSR